MISIVIDHTMELSSDKLKVRDSERNRYVGDQFHGDTLVSNTKKIELHHELRNRFETPLDDTYLGDDSG